LEGIRAFLRVMAGIQRRRRCFTPSERVEFELPLTPWEHGESSSDYKDGKDEQ
jgi:hypothetical protein